MSTETKTRTPVTRRVRTLDLVYGQEVTAELPAPLKMLGVHAMKDPGDTSNRRHVTKVNPKLVYLFEADKKLQEITFLLLRGEADLPLDTSKRYDFVAMTEDRDSATNSFATLWLVSPWRQG